MSGAHNFHRGGELYFYNEWEISKILYADALFSQWKDKSVRVHGDIAIGNFLVKDGKLKAVIDFG